VPSVGVIARAFRRSRELFADLGEKIDKYPGLCRGQARHHRIGFPHLFENQQRVSIEDRALAGDADIAGIPLQPAHRFAP